MKIKHIVAALTLFSGLFLTSISRADDITAIASGSWGDTNIWNSQIVPGTNDTVDIPSGFTVTVDTNASAQEIYDSGTVVMAANSTLTLVTDSGIQPETTLNATAAGNTVIYMANPYYAVRMTSYYNLILSNTNYVDPFPPYSPVQDFNNFNSRSDTPASLTIAGDMTLMGAIKVQQGTDDGSDLGPADISIGGNLIIGTGCIWDSSGANLTVAGDTFVYGSLQDLNSNFGSNYFGGNVIVAGPSTSIINRPGGVYTNGWYVKDAITWGVGGGLTNNGSIFGSGYGSISFNGAGAITGSNTLMIPTLTVNGTYAIGTSITLITNTPTLNGTLVFDIANPKQIILLTNAGTALYYSGNLEVVNSGPAPASGATFKFFGCTNGFGGAFDSTSYPGLPAGLSWDDSALLTSGSISVIGGIVGSPTLSFSKSGGMLTLSWDSATYPGYSVQAQTNKAGIGTSWSSTGSGTTSPFMIAINPTNPPVFFRLSNP